MSRLSGWQKVISLAVAVWLLSVMTSVITGRNYLGGIGCIVLLFAVGAYAAAASGSGDVSGMPVRGEEGGWPDLDTGEEEDDE